MITRALYHSLDLCANGISGRLAAIREAGIWKLSSGQRYETVWSCLLREDGVPHRLRGSAGLSCYNASMTLKTTI